MPYGAIAFLDATFGSRAASNVDAAYAFMGRRLDAESDVYFYRNRYYSGTLGIFLSRDPSSYRDGMKLDCFVASNPTKYVDSTGLQRDPIRDCQIWVLAEKKYTKIPEITIGPYFFTKEHCHRLAKDEKVTIRPGKGFKVEDSLSTMDFSCAGQCDNSSCIEIYVSAVTSMEGTLTVDVPPYKVALKVPPKKAYQTDEVHCISCRCKKC